jgi:hypothetical protein
VVVALIAARRVTGSSPLDPMSEAPMRDPVPQQNAYTPIERWIIVGLVAHGLVLSFLPDLGNLIRLV